MFRLVLVHGVQRGGTDGDKQSGSSQPQQAMKSIALARGKADGKCILAIPLTENSWSICYRRQMKFPTVAPMMDEKTNRRGGEVCVEQQDGTYSDAAIHEQIMAGVEDSDIRARTRAELNAKGVPAAALNSVFPDLPQLPAE